MVKEVVPDIDTGEENKISKVGALKATVNDKLGDAMEKVGQTKIKASDKIIQAKKVIKGARDGIEKAMKEISEDLTQDNIKNRVILDILIENKEVNSELIIPYFRAVFTTVFPDYIKEQITFDDFLSEEDKKVLAFDFNHRTDNQQLFDKKKEVLSDIQELYDVLQSLSKPGIGDEVLTLLLHPEKAKTAEYNFVSVNTDIPEGARRLLNNLIQKVNSIQEERDKEIDNSKAKLSKNEELNPKDEKLLVESLKRNFVSNSSQKVLHYLNQNFSLELIQYLLKIVEDEVIRNMAIDMAKKNIEQDDIPELKSNLSSSEYAQLKAKE